MVKVDDRICFWAIVSAWRPSESGVGAGNGWPAGAKTNWENADVETDLIHSLFSFCFVFYSLPTGMMHLEAS